MRLSIFMAAMTAAAAISLHPVKAQQGSSQGTVQCNAVHEARAYLSTIESDSNFKGASIGVLAVTADGDTILKKDFDKLLVPASNMKLVTTALALQTLGSDYRFETKIGYSGTISDGVLKGDLYIIGGGDPTLCSRNPIARTAETTFSQWHRILSDAGIRKIEGYIIGDGRYFPGMMEQESWQMNDSGTYYGTGVSGLSFNENVQGFRVAPGQKPGDPVQINPAYPDAPWMKYIYSCTTGKKGTGNTLYFYTSNFAPVGEMRGTFAIDRKPKTEEAANKFPEYTCAHYFKEYLASHGAACTMGPADIGLVFNPANRRQTAACNSTSADSHGGNWKACPAEELTIIGSTFSPELSKIASVTNKESNNLYAEALMKAIGKEYCGEGCYDSAYVAVEGILKELGIDSRKVRIRDGSGLSRENHISPEFFCQLLKAMMSSPVFEAYFESFPWPGGAGTLKYMMQSVPEDIKARIRMKSGSMSDVRCFSGYIVPRSGSREDTIIFSIMVNNFTVPLSRIQTRLDRLIEVLAKCN